MHEEVEKCIIFSGNHYSEIVGSARISLAIIRTGNTHVSSFADSGISLIDPSIFHYTKFVNFCELPSFRRRPESSQKTNSRNAGQKLKHVE